MFVYIAKHGIPKRHWKDPETVSKAINVNSFVTKAVLAIKCVQLEILWETEKWRE